MKKLTASLLLFTILSGIGYTQNTPLIINEVGVMPNSNQNYIEFLVRETLGNSINLSDWVVDIHGVTLNNENIYLRLGDCFSAVPSGTLVLIYNDFAPHPEINTSNDGYSEENQFLQIPLSSACLLKGRGNYEDDLELTNIPVNQLSEIFSFGVNGDAVQIYDSDHYLHFALNWKGEGLENHEAYQVVNIDITQYPVLNSIILNDVPCDEDHYAQFQGSIGATPGRENTPVNEQYITNFRNGVLGTPLDIYCSELSPASSEEGKILVTIYSGVPPFTISWSGNNGTQGSMEVFTNEEHIIGNLVPGYYDIVVRDNRGCEKVCNSFVRLEVTERLCEGECVTLGEDLDGENCYYWGPVDALGEGAVITNKTQIVCPEETTSYQVIITDTDGNQVEIIDYTVQVVSDEASILPNPPIICEGQEIELSVQGDWVSYNWNVPGETNPTLTINTVNIPYAVTVTDENGCQAIGQTEAKDPTQNPEAIIAFFQNLGFAILPIIEINEALTDNDDPVGRNSNTNCQIYNYLGDYSISLKSEYELESLGDFDIEAALIEECNLDENEVTYYITDNDDFCNQSLLNEILSAWSSGSNVTWHHIFNGDEPTYIVGSNFFNYYSFYSNIEGLSEFVPIEEDNFESIPDEGWQDLNFVALDMLAINQTEAPSLIQLRNSDYVRFKQRLGRIVEQTIGAFQGLWNVKPFQGCCYSNGVFTLGDQVPTPSGCGKPDYIHDLVVKYSDGSYRAWTVHSSWQAFLTMQPANLFECKTKQYGGISLHQGAQEGSSQYNQLPNYIAFLDHKKVAWKYETYRRYYFGIGHREDRNPTLDKAATLHMITLSNNGIASDLVNEAQLRNVRLLHSTYQYKEYNGKTYLRIKFQGEKTSYPNSPIDVTGLIQYITEQLVISKAAPMKWYVK